MVPENWERTTVGQLGAPGKPAIKAGPFGSALKKEFYAPSGYKVYGQEQVIAKDPFFGDYYIDESKYLELSSCAVEPGDILLSLVGTVGKVLLLPEGSEPGIINPRLLRLSLDKRRVHGPFMAHYLESDLVVNRLESWAQGGTMGVLNARLVRDLPVLLPPLPEQHQIARVIDTWDAAIRAVEKVAAAKRERKRGLMQVLLTGMKRFEEFEDTTWKVTEIQDVADINPSRNQRREDFKGEFVEMAGVSEEGRLITVNQVDPSLPPSGYSNFVNWDTLVAKITPCFENGKGALIEGLKGLALGSTEFHVLSPKPTIRPKFLYYLTRTHDFRQRGIATMQGSGGQRRVPADFIRRLKVKMPSLEEQDRIVDVLSTADAEIENLEKQLEAYKLQKRGLMQQLLTGKKRAKVEDSEVIPA